MNAIVDFLRILYSFMKLLGFSGATVSFCLSHQQCVVLFNLSVVVDSPATPGIAVAGFLSLWDFPGKMTGVGCHFLLQESSWPRDQPASPA